MTTFKELIGENAGRVTDTIASMLAQIDHVQENTGENKLSAKYRAEAYSGNYQNLLEVSFKYAAEWMPVTLGISQDTCFSDLMDEYEYEKELREE